MTDWIKEQFENRTVRGEELTFDELFYGLESEGGVDALIERALQQKGRHVGRG